MSSSSWRRQRADVGLSIAVVGVGGWGPNVIRNLREIHSADIAMVCDIDDQALANVAGRWPDIPLTTDYDVILDDDSIDAVAIATPISTHFDLARRALEAGKHVFVEKPLAGSLDEAQQLVDLAKAAGLVLMPGHTFLYSPPAKLVRDLIASGELGDIYFVTMSRVNLGIHQPDASVIWDLSPHDISILLMWLGELPQRVSAMSRSCITSDYPDVAFLNLEFPSGTLATIENAWLAPAKLRRTVVVGSARMLVYDDTSPDTIQIYDQDEPVKFAPRSYGEFHQTRRTGRVVSPSVTADEPLHIELCDFCDSILEHRAPYSSAEFGVDVVRVVESIDTSLTLGGTPVDLASATLSRL